jgi:predicted nuclease of restriction endonuclease-like (RecB) superfamily
MSSDSMGTSDLRVSDFQELLTQIHKARNRAFAQANAALIELYWEIGKTISLRVERAGWGKGVVTELAGFIAKQDPTLKGFSDKNLWRMKQFYETYQADTKLATLWRELSWSHNRLVMTIKSKEAREFYLNLAVVDRLSVRELERQVNVATFERVQLGTQNLSALLRESHPAIDGSFKDSYVLEFLGLPEKHTEGDLQRAMLQQMRQFILELGKDFIFVSQEHRLQVGTEDFYIDLLFFHRGLSALVAFELKAENFKPEHIGQLNFYLEALDRDVRKPHENPSIGVLLCSSKNDEVVEYAMARNMSPTLVAEYQLQLPDKKLLQAKLHQIHLELEAAQAAEGEHDLIPIQRTHRLLSS